MGGLGSQVKIPVGDNSGLNGGDFVQARFIIAGSGKFHSGVDLGSCPKLSKCLRITISICKQFLMKALEKLVSNVLEDILG